MAKKLPKRAEATGKKNDRSHSLISDDTFRSMLTTMIDLRNAAKRGAPKHLEAMLAGTTLDLREGDCVLSPGGLFSDRYLASASPSFKHLSASPAIAVGAVWTLKEHGDSVGMAFCTAQQQGRENWIEAVTLAAKNHLPLLLVLLPAVEGGEDEMQIAAIASDATQAGIITIPVDATDAVAMYRVAFESIARARRGTGPTLIVGTRYALESGEQQSVEDPIARMKTYMKAKGIPAEKSKSALGRKRLK